MSKLEDYIPQSEETSETSICQDCGAVYMNGRWRWMAHPPHDTAKTICMACRRIHDKKPAGVVTIQGKFSREHSDELLALIRNIELEKKAENPLQRIMSIDKRAEKLSIATTDAQLARGIGKALRQQYKGSLDFNYQRGEIVLRALWQR
ncbi:MAG TPA: BCAM0308 family protein [Burkholderiaceae bacterium]|jgi:NMD protein affecting ribosome stability and mRNA decay